MKRLICLLRGHRYYVVQEFTTAERRVACARCERTWAMHDGRQAFVPWDKDLEQLYRDMGYPIVQPWRQEPAATP